MAVHKNIPITAEVLDQLTKRKKKTRFINLTIIIKYNMYI